MNFVWTWWFVVLKFQYLIFDHFSCNFNCDQLFSMKEILRCRDMLLIFSDVNTLLNSLFSASALSNDVSAFVPSDLIRVGIRVRVFNLEFA